MIPSNCSQVFGDMLHELYKSFLELLSSFSSRFSSFPPGDDILLPSSTSFSSNTTNNNPTSEPTKKPIAIGSTWTGAGINIDLDNLVTKATKTAAPSMNQLKSANTSPVKSASAMSPQPMGASNFSFNQQQSNNNNSFNQFNAFQ